MKDKILAHFEKAILLLALALMGFFVYSSLTVETYNRTPEDFVEITGKASKNLEKSEPNFELTAPDFTGVAAELGQDLEAQQYKYFTQWMRRFDFGKTFRNEPVIHKPSKVYVQANRGLLAMYLTDLEGKRKTKKVKKAEARGNIVDPQFAGGGQPQSMFAKMGISRAGMEGMEGMSGGMGEEMADFSGEDMMMGMGGSGGMGGAGMGMGAYAGGSSAMGGMGGGGYPAGGMGGAGSMSAFSGGSSGMGSGGMGYSGGSAMSGMMQGMMFGGNEGMMDSAMGFDASALAAELPAAPKRKMDRLQRFALADALLAKKEDPKDPKKKKKEEDEWVEEYIEGMVGKHWVEIVAPFPHSQQIKEYVKALREPAAMTALRYAYVEVERQQLQSDQSWSPWRMIDLFDQNAVISNALAYEPEDYVDVVVPGMAMNVPMVQTAFRPFLHYQVAEFEEPKLATYAPEELNPRLTEVKKVAEKKRPLRRLPGQTEKNDEPAKEEPKQNILQKRSAVVKLGQEKKKDEKDAKGKAQDEVFNNRFMVNETMIRYWDFTVLPGRRYRYRVRVAVFNPNYDRSDVAAAEHAVGLYRVGDWSEPSEEVYVEPDVQWFAMAKSAKSSDKAIIQLQHWSRDMGDWITTEIEQQPGDVIGRSGKIETVEVVKWDESQKAWTLKAIEPDQSFSANQIVLDVSGGRMPVEIEGQVRKNLNLPNELVAVNMYGDLVRRSSFLDESDTIRSAIQEQYKATIDEMKGKVGAGGPAGPAGGNPITDPLRSADPLKQ